MPHPPEQFSVEGEVGEGENHYCASQHATGIDEPGRADSDPYPATQIKVHVPSRGYLTSLSGADLPECKMRRQ